MSLMSRNARNGENGERSPEGWQFKLDAKSGSLESDDFGENDEIGNLAKMTKNHQAPWRVAILAKLFGVGVPEELSQLYSGGSVILYCII